MNKERLRRALCDLKPRVWEDRPQSPVVDFPGQLLGRERLHDQFSSESCRDSDWFMNSITSKVTQGKWNPRSSYHRRFWMAERIQWAINYADEGSGPEWLHKWFVREWENAGWKPVVERLVSEALADERSQVAEWERDHY